MCSCIPLFHAQTFYVSQLVYRQKTLTKSLNNLRFQKSLQIARYRATYFVDTEERKTARPISLLILIEMLIEVKE
jgi:hypothetical protein